MLWHVVTRCDSAFLIPVYKGSCYHDNLVTNNQVHLIKLSHAHSSIQRERERERDISAQSQEGREGWTFFSLHMTTWSSSLPPSVSQSVFTSCCMQLPPQRVGESRRKMRGEERWELQLPNREWRRKNALWDGVEDPPHLRTQSEVI